MGLSLLRREWLRALVLLGVVAWLAHFFLAGSFGLYEDDYFFIGEPMIGGWPYVVDRLKVFATLPQGRPIGFFLPQLLAFLGNAIGGLAGVYLLGALVVLLNAFLFYLLLRRYRSQTVAWLGALAFLLFPADTTKILLTHDFQLQPSLTFLLLASLAYSYGRLWLAYVAIVGSLLSYESTFLVFLGIPLLRPRWDRRLARELARHAAVLVAILLVGVLVRRFVGEGRVIEATGSLAEILPKVVGSLLIGPFRSLVMFLYAPARSVPLWTPLVAALALASLPIVYLSLRHSLRASSNESPESSPARSVELLVAGLVLLALAYVLAFTHYPPTAVNGRGTSVHLAATVGASVVFAWLGSEVLALASRRGLREPATALIALYVAAVVGYHGTIQADFARSWQIQRAFWSSVVACCSDATEDTIVINVDDQPVQTMFILSSSWGEALIYAQLYQYPHNWRNPPRLFTLGSDWQARVYPEGDHLAWIVPPASWDEHPEVLPNANVILLHRQGDGVARVTGDLQVAGRTLRLKDPPVASAPPPRNALYPYLVAAP